MPAGRKGMVDSLSRNVYSVSELNAEARDVLDSHFGAIWVSGELSNISRPRSGHLYFSLKDEHAQVRAAMFRGRNRYLDFSPQDGAQVLVQARVGLYAARGDYQLIVEYMEQAGSGALRRAFEMLKNKLAGEGLFAAEHKQPLPSLPVRVGVISSTTGAALHDVLTVLGRRCPAIPVDVMGVSVQGAYAASEIAAAIRRAHESAEIEVVILARGGGSAEDLQAFNEESVARAIFACRKPLITGVGHETDFTIADFVADIRAPTPSSAAELAVPNTRDLLATLSELSGALSYHINSRLTHSSERVRLTAKRLRHPRDRVAEAAQHLDHLHARLSGNMRYRLDGGQRALQALQSRLLTHAPRSKLAALATSVEVARDRLIAAARHRVQAHRTALSNQHRTLQATGPQPTLARGYAILRKTDGDVVRSTEAVERGEMLAATLADGSLTVAVSAKRRQKL